MKICPSCQTKYEEEILRFCIKDGSPLVEEKVPTFTELPSESLRDDLAEITVVRKPKVPEPPPIDEMHESEPPRLVIPMTEQPRPQARPQASRKPVPQPVPPRQANIFKVIVLTVVCTVAVLAGIALLVWSLGSGPEDASNVNANTNANVDTNLNTNLNMNGFNFNMNINANVNANANANLNMNVNANANTAGNANANLGRPDTNAANSNANVRPSPTPASNANAVNRPVNRPANQIPGTSGPEANRLRIANEPR